MLIYGLLLLLLSTAVNNRRDCSILFARVSLLILILSTFNIFINIHLPFLDGGLILFNGLITLKTHGLVICCFILALSTSIMGLSSFFPRKLANKYLHFYPLYTLVTNKMHQQFRLIEYPLIVLFSLTGAVFLIVSSDLISIFLSLELQSYALYLICSIYRNSEASILAGLTYFLLGGLSSCIILLGFALLYLNTGNTNLSHIFIIYNVYLTQPVGQLALFSNNIDLLQLPFALISVGLLFKISAAPFHFWSPEIIALISGQTIKLREPPQTLKILHCL